MAQPKPVFLRSFTACVLAVGLTQIACFLTGCEAGTQAAVEGASEAGGQGTQCLSQGAACTDRANCCSGLSCCDGRCTEAAGCVRVPSCKEVSLPCAYNQDCCSGACAATGNSTGKICQGVDGCRPIGESCEANEECCSKKCAESNGSLKCVLTNENALAPGELCGALAPFGLSCSVQPSAGTEPNPCVRSRSGVERCRSFEPRTGLKPVDEVCATASECLQVVEPGSPGPSPGTNFCLPSVTHETKCSNTCRALDEDCRASSDCCFDESAPLRCEDGRCLPTGASCRELSSQCDPNIGGCCSGFCVLLVTPPSDGASGGPGVLPTFCAVPPA